MDVFFCWLRINMVLNDILKIEQRQYETTYWDDLGYGQCIVPVTTAKLQNQPGCPTEGVDQENMAYTCNGSSHCKE